MNNRNKIKGRCEIYDLNEKFVTSFNYEGRKDRDTRIERFKKFHPRLPFVLIIQPEINLKNLN